MQNLLNYIKEPERRVVPNSVVLQVNIVLMIHECPLMEQCIVLLVYLCSIIIRNCSESKQRL